MHYYLIVALQAFCIYHLYRNKNEFYWYFLIIFIPILGSLIYIILKVYNRRDADKIQQELTTIINPTKRISDLAKKLEFSDTFQNKVNLADAYFDMGGYKNAINHYEDAIRTSFQNDQHVIKRLIEAYSQLENYENVINYAQRIHTKFDFKTSRSQFLYAVALEKTSRLEEATQQFRQIDIPNSNYEERLIYAKFLLNNKKNEEGRELLTELQEESRHMIKANKRNYNGAIREVTQLLNEM